MCLEKPEEINLPPGAAPELHLQAVLAAQEHLREKRKTPACRSLAMAKVAGTSRRKSTQRQRHWSNVTGG